MKQISIPDGHRLKVAAVQSIVRIQASSNYSIIYFSNDRPLLVARVLRRFEQLLPRDVFQRIHRTHLVNRSYITGFSANKRVQLSNGELLPVSRRKMQRVIKEIAC